jgi:TolA-binding protein
MHRALLHFTMLCAAVMPMAVGCAAMKLPKPSWPGSASSAPVGTAQWWKANKHKKVFAGPGKGWTVPGVPGYFDDDGRPINVRAAKVVEAKDSGGGLLGDADFQKHMKGVKETVGLGPNQTEAQSNYAEAEDLFRREKYSEAAKLFKKAASGWPDSQLEQDAMYRMAESYFFAKQYARASNAYEKLVRKHTNTQYLDNVMARQFSIARYWEQYHSYNSNWVTTPNVIDKKRPLFDTIGRAMKAYENIRLNDPTGPLADDAVMAMANSYFVRGRYGEADQHYDTLRKEYPRSEHQYRAHELGLQCKLRKYQGPSYDGKPLEEAKVLVKQLKIQFYDELDQQQKARLAEIDAQVNRELAQREFNMGKHFDGIEEFGSARFYYAEVIKNFPDTQLAADARKRLEEIGGEPERPSSILDPALDLLPESDERRAIAEVPLKPDALSPSLSPDDGQIRSAGATQDEAEQPIRR